MKNTARNHHRIVVAILCFAAAFSVEAQGQLVWEAKGPAPLLLGSVENISAGPVAGALEAVVAHPTNPDILWVGSVNGGVFRTLDATASIPIWTAQTDHLRSLSIAALELDPTDGSHQTLVAGIGHTSAYGGIGGALEGVMRTTDGGVSWTLLPSANLVGLDLRGVAPRGSTLVAAVRGPFSSCSSLGIFRSTDSGSTFIRLSHNLFGGLSAAGLPCGFAFDLAQDPTLSTRLYVPSTGLGLAEDGLYRSSDTGATWTQVGAGSVMDMALEATPAVVQVVAGRGGGNLFVATCASGRLSGLFHSPDGGTNWSSLDLPQTTELFGAVYGVHPGGQCNPHLSLVADPLDHSVVYVGGDRQPAANEALQGNAFPNSIGASGFVGRLFRVDADLAPGSQARPITHCAPPLPAACGGQASTASDSAPHADSREMVFDANGDLIEVDDGGVYRHTDPLGGAGDWQSVVGNLAAIEQHDSAYDSLSNIIISGNQDNGSGEQLLPASSVWATVRGGDGGDVVVAPGDPLASQSTRYASAQNLQSLTRRIYDAANVLVTAMEPTLTPIGGSPAIAPQFKTPLAVNALDPTRLIAGGANGVYESLTRLDTINRISTARITSFTGGSPIAYGRPGNAELLYFGTATQVCQRIGAPGAAVSCTTLTADFRGITAVVLDPDSDTVAFAVDVANVFRTNNAGSTWSAVTGDLFTAPGNNAGNINFAEYVNGPGGDLLVVGTDTGVYAASEGAGFSTWTPLGISLPNAPVYELDYDPADDVLLAGTLGRGAWLLDFGGCPANAVIANTTLSAAATFTASNSITLGPGLEIDGAGVHMVSPATALGPGTAVTNTFSATPGTCP
ncbi:MAG: RTX toxin [Acidobacteriota bacterium]